MSQNKTIAKNSLILYLRLIITSIIGLFATRIVIQNLGVSDYGLYSVVGGVVVMMNFLNTVMTSTTYRFIAFEMGRKDHDSVNKVFNISLSIHIGMAFIAILLAETIGIWYINNKLNIEPGKISDAIFVFRFSVLAAIFNIISIPYQGLITAVENFKFRASVEITRSILRFLFVIILIFFVGNKLRLYSVLMAIIALIASLLFVGYCNTKYLVFTKWKIQRDKEKYREMISFSGWIMFGAAASVSKSTGSALIINAFFGTILNASLGIANQLNGFIMMFSRNLGQAAIPQIVKSHSGGDSKRTLDLVAYISKYSFFLMLFPALPLLLETDYLLHLWLGDVPEYTVIFTRLMIINGLFESVRSGVPSAVQATGKIKWFQIILSSLLLISLPVSYFLFKLGFPPYSIHIAYIISSVLITLVSLFLLKKLINFNVMFLVKTSYFKIIAVSAFMVPLFFLHNIFTESMLRLIITMVFSVLYYLTIVYVIGLDVKEKKVIKKTIIKLKDRFNR